MTIVTILYQDNYQRCVAVEEEPETALTSVAARIRKSTPIADTDGRLFLAWDKSIVELTVA